MAGPSALPRSANAALTAAVSVALIAIGALAPLPAGCTHGSGDDTHLLCTVRVAQPLGPALFVTLPLVALAVLLITDLMILFDGSRAPGWARAASRVIGLAAAPVMLGLSTALAIRGLAHTAGQGFLGVADLLAFVSYEACVIPAVVVTLVELDFLGKDRRTARQLHARAASVALLLAIIAITFSVFEVPGGH